MKASLNYLCKILRKRLLIIPCLLSIVWAALYTGLLWKYPTLEEREYDKGELTGTVNEKAYAEDGNLKYIIVNDVMVYNNDNISMTELVIGQKVKLKGKISPFEGPMNRGEFDNRFYQAVRGNYFYMKPTGLECITRLHKSFRESILEIRLSVYENLKTYCPFEYGTVSTLLLSDKRGLNLERKKLYQRVGCAHFLVVSGLHISILGGLIYRFLRRVFGVGAGACVGTIMILLSYGLFAGFGVSVIRAVLMFGIRLVGDVLKESYDPLSAVMFAALVTLFHNPLYIGDVSFIYSYGTVFALAVYSETSEKYDDALMNRKDVIEVFFRLPWIFPVAMVPMTLYLSFEYSLLSVFVNLIISVLAIPILVIATMAMIFAQLKISLAAGLFDFFLACILRSFDKLCMALELVPETNLMGKPYVWQVVAYYGVLYFFWRVFHKKVSKVVRLSFYVALMLFVSERPVFRDYLSALYVGQGDCVVIRTDSGKGMLIDAGSSSDDNMYSNILLPFLKAEGIKELSSVFISHGDNDHTGGVEDMLSLYGRDGIKIGKICVSRAAMSKDSGVMNILSLADAKNIPIETLEYGNVLTCDNWIITCLAPMPGKIYNNGNEASMVLYFYNINSGFDALFTGDIGTESERLLAESIRMNDKICLLKVAHHGSKYSTSETFLNAFSFDYAIISAGRNNIYGHPHSETLRRLEKNGITYYISMVDGEKDIFTE